MGAKRVADKLNVTQERAEQCQQALYTAFPAIKSYEKRILSDAKKSGFVSTITGRRRYVPHLNHENWEERMKAAREAFNTVVQGSAADIVKLGMIKIAVEIANNSWKDASPRILMQIHDEVLLECHIDDIEKLKRVVKMSLCESCEKDFALRVPLLLDFCVGRSWGDGMKEIPMSQDLGTEDGAA